MKQGTLAARPGARKAGHHSLIAYHSDPEWPSVCALSVHTIERSQLA